MVEYGKYQFYIQWIVDPQDRFAEYCINRGQKFIGPYDPINMSYCYPNQRNKCMAWVKRVYVLWVHLP